MAWVEIQCRTFRLFNVCVDSVDFLEVSVNCRIHQVCRVKAFCLVFLLLLINALLFILDIRSYGPVSDNEWWRLFMCHCALACANVLKGKFLITSIYWAKSALIFKLACVCVHTLCGNVAIGPIVGLWWCKDRGGTFYCVQGNAVHKGYPVECVYVCMCVHACVRVCVFVCVSVCVSECVCACSGS